MAAKIIPANDISNTDHRNFVRKESVGQSSGSHITIPLADQAYDQYDMCVSLPWCGIVDVGVSAGEPVVIHADEGIQIDTAQVETGSTFGTFGGEVWYNTATKLYADTDQAGYYRVGFVTIVLDSKGVFRFEKTRYAIESDLT